MALVASAYSLDPREVAQWPSIDVMRWAAAADIIEAERQESLATLVMLAMHDPVRLMAVVNPPQVDARSGDEILADTLSSWGVPVDGN